MPWFKRHEETYNEQMLREAGLGTPEPKPKVSQRLPSVRLPSDRDVYTTCEAPGVGGATVEFATLPEGDVIVDEQQGDADLSPFADAVEQHLRPPYRAIGRREEGALWSVLAWPIEVRRFERGGDEFEDVEGDTVTRGQRLDGDLWEIREDRL